SGPWQSGSGQPAGPERPGAPLPDVCQYGTSVNSLEHAAEDFAADIGVASLGIRHHAARGRQDRDTHAAAHLAEVGDRRIDATARLRHAVDRLDDRLTLVILQLDAEVALVAVLNHFVAADIAFLLEDLEHVHTQLRGRASDGGLARLLTIADAGQHIAKGIGESHAPVLLTSST